MSVVGTSLVIGAILAFLFLAIGPRFLGYQAATMLTGSIAPSIVPSDVVVTTRQPVADVQVVEDHRVETHRVIEVITNADGTTAVRTKGDANEAVDPWIATLDGDHVHEQAFIIPGLGEAIRALRTPIVGTALVYGAPAVLVVGLLAMIGGRPAAGTTGGFDNTPEGR
ncbi:signal peptidase I [Arthrobacter sp. L77]|uniref:signal peptidase I n=1 Tax=Arthrobacter sp. L77 TaxID=1496689 RepID=UPI0018CDEB69|nr:signal peptidase I [Arthrobacter sp. L77]